jgi:SAM-dependent methyltransferase
MSSSCKGINRPGPAQRAGARIYDLVNGGMEKRIFSDRRYQLLQAARGRVLDVGAGTGANLPHYRMDQISRLVLLDVGRGMLDRAAHKAAELGIEVELHSASAEQLPFEEASFDTVVFTLCLCTIPDPGRALREAGRVLDAGGRLLALEHVRAEDPGLARWQARVNPFWKAVNSGCNLNRPTSRNIEAAGFVFESLDEHLETRLPIPVVRPWLVAVARKAAGDSAAYDETAGAELQASP